MKGTIMSAITSHTASKEKERNMLRAQEEINNYYDTSEFDLAKALLSQFRKNTGSETLMLVNVRNTDQVRFLVDALKTLKTDQQLTGLILPNVRDAEPLMLLEGVDSRTELFLSKKSISTNRIPQKIDGITPTSPSQVLSNLAKSGKTIREAPLIKSFI